MPGTFTVADAAVAVGADFKSYDAALGKKTTETRGKLAKLGQAVKDDFGLVFGAIAGGVAAAVLKVGETWDDAFDTIRTSTGKTGDALAALQDDLRATAGTVSDDVGVTAQALADLNKRTGQTGQSLRDLTKQELDLARITKTDVNRNVAASTRLFGDWSIAAEDQAATLDKLYRASTATGIGVDVLMEKVVQFGSPMRLLGFSFEESIALLGKWEKEGVNTETAMSGLKFAVKSLAAEGVPAADMARVLQERIAGIQASADPVGDSLKLFGLRAGPDLAAAIVEGRFATEDLLEVINNGGDTIAAATADTEDFGAVFAKLRNQVGSVIGPMAAGFGDLASTIGPLLYAFPALGGAMGRFFQRVGGLGVRGISRAFDGIAMTLSSSRFVNALSSGLGSALGKVTASPRISGGLAKLGNFMGSKLGKGLSIAFAAVAIVEVVETYNRIKAGLDEQNAQISAGVANQIKVGSDAQLAESKAALEQGLKDINKVWDAGLFTTDSRAKMEADLAAVNAEAARRAAMTPEAVAAELKAGQAEVDAAAADMVDGIPGEVDTAKEEAWKTAAEIPLGLAEGIRSRRGAAEQAMTDLIDGINNAMSPAKERARLIGYLTSDELANGLKSRDPAVRAQAEASRDLWLAQLAEMPVGANGLGKRTMNELNKALHDKNPAVRAEARRVKQIIEEQIRAAKAREAGEKIDRDVAKGIDANKGVVASAVRRVGNVIITTFLNGLPQGSSFNGRDRAGASASYAVGTTYVPDDGVAQVHRGEIIVPADESDAIRAGRAVLGQPDAAGARSGASIEVNVYNPAPEPASTSTRRELRKLALSGSAF